MKRNVILIALAILILSLAAVGYRPMLIARERHRRHSEMVAAEREAGPLVLDATTKSILAGADRVETFRLAGGDNDEAGMESLSGPHPPSLDGYGVLRVGPSQGRAFAGALQGALSQANAEQDGAQCFDPVIGFRVWKGGAHTDVCACFFCAGIEITTKDAHHRILHQSRTGMGASRSALLVLSRQAFPQDKVLAAVKDTED